MFFHVAGRQSLLTRAFPLFFDLFFHATVLIYSVFTLWCMNIWEAWCFYLLESPRPPPFSVWVATASSLSFGAARNITFHSRLAFSSTAWLLPGLVDCRLPLSTLPVLWNSRWLLLHPGGSVKLPEGWLIKDSESECGCLLGDSEFLCGPSNRSEMELNRSTQTLFSVYARILGWHYLWTFHWIQWPHSEWDLLYSVLSRFCEAAQLTFAVCHCPPTLCEDHFFLSFFHST